MAWFGGTLKHIKQYILKLLNNMQSNGSLKA